MQLCAFSSQRTQTGAYVSGAVPFHVPRFPLSVCPTIGVPEMDGSCASDGLASDRPLAPTAPSRENVIAQTITANASNRRGGDALMTLPFLVERSCEGARPVREGHHPESMTRLPEAVEPGEPLREQADEERRWQPDDVQVVAVDRLDERGAAALDRVAAGASLPLRLRHVVRDVARVERAERDPRHRVVELLPRVRAQAEPGDDLVRTARERLEHRRGIARVARLRVDAPV